MGKLVLYIISILLLVAVSHAALSPQEIYWKSVLPNTPMPSAISDLLPDAFVDEKYTNVGVGKGGVDVNTGKGNGAQTNVNVGHGGVHVKTGPYKGPGGGTNVNVGHGGVHVNTGPYKGQGTNVNVGSHNGVNVHTGPYKGKGGSTNVNVGGHGGVHVHTGPYKGKGGGTNVNVGGHSGVNVHTVPHKGKPPVNVQVGPLFNYLYAARESQIHDDPNVALFFLQDDLRPGKKFSLLFTKTISGSTFVPRKVAESVPFSSSKYVEILKHFSINPLTEEAKKIKNTIEECEKPSVANEKKHCATSLESMVDFSVSSLGTNKLEVFSTKVSKEETKPEIYTITSGGVKSINVGNELVACHPENYVFALFYCHATTTSEAYTVEMVGVDGAKVEAVAVCHTNTKEWNPEHVAFKVLKVKPGAVPVCHFVPQDHVVWSRSG